MIWLISAITFLTPLFFLPILSDPNFLAKNLFFEAAILILVAFAGVRLWWGKKLRYNLSFLDLLVVLFWVINLISWFFLSDGAKVRSLLQPLGFGTISALTLFYFSIAQLGEKKKNKLIFGALNFSAVFCSLVAVTLFLLPPPFLAKINFIGNSLWSPTGSVFILAQFLLPLTVLLIFKLSGAFSKGEKKVGLLILPVIFLVGLGVSLFQIFKAKPFILDILDGFSSWAVTIESFKRSPILGVGPANFGAAFDLYRPLEFNQKINWGLKFSQPRSWLLQVWAETGIFGLALVLLLLFFSLKGVKKRENRLFLASVWLALVFLPANLITLFLIFISLALFRKEGRERSFSLIIGEGGKDGASAVVGTLFLLFSIASGYFFVRALYGELLFYQSLVAASQNKAGDTYNFQIKAIRQNRFLSRYRITFSQTNLALANGLAGQKELSDEQKTQITQLLNQAVNEAKAAVALEPKNVLGWENLARIYRQMINVANGADSWALLTYQQAVALEPLNPALRIDFGSLYYALGNFEEAAKQFEIAVNLKSDYANAWYNWAWALKQQKKLEQAIEKLQQALNLVKVESPDYEKANKELEEWKKELGEAAVKKTEEAKKPEQLVKPEPLPSPSFEEPIKLSEEAKPPLMETTPTPEAATTPTPPLE